MMDSKLSEKRRTGRSFVSAPMAAELGVALIDLAFRPIAMDEGAVSIFSAMSDEAPQGDGDGVADELPPAVLEQIRRAGVPGAGSKVMRFVAANRSYSARACLMHAETETIPGPCIILRFERDEESGDALRELSLTCRLTDREKETLSAVAIGLTSKEVAQRMNISPSTVKAFLRLIKIKTGGRNRADIVARLLDPQNRSGHYHGGAGGSL